MIHKNALNESNELNIHKCTCKCVFKSRLSLKLVGFLDRFEAFRISISTAPKSLHPLGLYAHLRIL